MFVLDWTNIDIRSRVGGINCTVVEYECPSLRLLKHTSLTFVMTLLLIMWLWQLEKIGGNSPGSEIISPIAHEDAERPIDAEEIRVIGFGLARLSQIEQIHVQTNWLRISLLRCNSSLAHWLHQLRLKLPCSIIVSTARKIILNFPVLPLFIRLRYRCENMDRRFRMLQLQHVLQNISYRKLWTTFRTLRYLLNRLRMLCLEMSRS